jgi:hypothetical protein
VSLLALFPITVNIPGIQAEKCPQWWFEKRPVMPCGSVQVAYPVYMIIGGPQLPVTFGTVHDCWDPAGRRVDVSKSCTKLYEVTVNF